VCDVWFLEPQQQRPDETTTQFANRVKELICKKVLGRRFLSTGAFPSLIAAN
jgi:hypothetical protein